MEYTYIKSKNTTGTLETIVGELYIFTLPFRQVKQFSFLNSFVGSCANWLPFVFHCIGILLWIINNNGRIEIHSEKKRLIKHAFFLMIFLNISSAIMSVIMQMIYGNHGTESAYQGIIGMCLYFAQYFFMFLYNYHIFEILSIERIKKILCYDCRILLFIAYFQIFVMNGIGAGIYDKLNFLGILNNSKDLPKLCLTGTEGASAGSLIAVFVFPFLLSKVIMGERKHLLELLLWIVPLYYTFSSTAYILAVISILTFIVLLLIHNDNTSKGIATLLIVIMLILLVFYIVTTTNLLSNKQIEQLQYLFFEKASDKNNGSTVSRTIPLLVNWGAFTEYPIMGVGNGLQGYFYEKYIPDWALRASGSDIGVFIERSRQGINNGGLFFPGILSGYGIVGCAAIAIFIWRALQEHQKTKLYSGIFYYSGIIAFLAFIMMGFQGDAYGLYYAWFMLSVPFIRKRGDQDSSISGSKSVYNTCM